ncbi:MAG: hypothetical protein IPO27_06970 [Bacteroidetes bacterium]|nr:hypothetical protein [Bacteroidota bacterium]
MSFVKVIVRMVFMSLLILSAMSSNLHSQTPLLEIKAGFDFFTTDRLGNIYLIDGSKISKYSAEGKELYVYDDYRYGNITQADMYDPFKIALFYKSFMQLRILNEQLALITETDLSTLPHLGIVSAIARTNENNYWIFDERNRQLKKMDASGFVLTMGPVLTKDSTQKILTPVSLCETENYLLLQDNKNHILAFDKFGNFYRSIYTPLQLAQVQGSADRVVYHNREGNLVFESIRDAELSNKPLEGLNDATQIRVEKNKLFIGTQNSLRVYAIE